MTITKEASGRYRVSIRWGMKDKGFGTFATREEAQKVHDEKMAIRPPTEPYKSPFDKSIDTFGLLNKLWVKS